MFNKTGIALIIGILCLSGWSWWQSQMISSLETTNRAQAQTIAEQKAVNEQLEISLQTEKQAVEKQQQIAVELKTQMETERERVKTIIIKEPCGNIAMPRAAIDGIKRLHSVGSNKD
ncbi:MULTISPECIES: DUF2570 family protein [Actinobacillus]|uniref:Uncharacterized protein n=2 Tax=Actinobacillus suis TaxID=716 RepID=K0GAK0_ACTSU|nr:MULTISPECIES: DUF2570 family protein [Actinobacillus]AFU18680.1 hypothetical protein ASU2_02690 [Actinobacillus suis H91-0380]MCO4167084.1 DUF2570 domain-containing protein [Actinobacillus suis]MCO4169207.1 DUF2570 domain-containing protein [Actinobacillus suis]MCQ9629811.1 DUF2570 domain-containing protein [Actinobacillus suis]MCQ9632245.1 DUF2570 domain-containing protein [Actinobacillus suis]